jgi:hypothetical protein
VSSTKAARRQPVDAGTAARSLHVGPFFLILALSASIAAFLVLRGQPLAALVLVAVTLVGAGLTAAATYRTIAPLSMPVSDEPLSGSSSRAELERDKALALRSLKELEFDHAMGKVSEADFAEVRDRLRARAVRLMVDLDGGTVYRARIERDAAELASAPVSQPEAQTCAGCGTPNDADAQFCKRCGRGLR